MEGAPTGHTPGEVSAVWGSSAAADVVGGGGGDRDTLGGCAVGREVGVGKCIRARDTITAKHLEPWWEQGRKTLGQRQPSQRTQEEGCDR